MKRAVIIVASVFGGALAWRIGGLLEPSNVMLIVGVFLGVLAGIPPALIVLAASRRKEHADRVFPVQQPQAPPIIMLGGGQNQPYSSHQTETLALPYNTSTVNSSTKGEIEHVNW